MGRTRSNWIPVQQAAQKLGCRVESVQELIGQGLLRKLSNGDKLYVHDSDIDDIVRLHGGAEMPPEEQRRRIVFLEQKVSRLEEALELMFQVNQMSSSRMETMEDEDLLKLYHSIVETEIAKEWTLHRILSCCEVFMRISEVEIERLNDLVDTKTSWRPFYELCLKQLRYVTTHEEFPVDINMQRSRDLLSRGRMNLRELAVLFIELEADKESSYEMLASVAKTDIDAFDALMRQMKKRNNRGRLSLL